MWQSVKVSNVFNTLKQIFWKTKIFFKKLEYRFLVETTKIENTSFPFKTALSEASVKTNRMVTTKWTYHKKWSFASNYFLFLENLFQFQKFLKRVNLMCQRPNYHNIMVSILLTLTRLYYHNMGGSYCLILDLHLITAEVRLLNIFLSLCGAIIDFSVSDLNY